MRFNTVARGLVDRLSANEGNNDGEKKVLGDGEKGCWGCERQNRIITVLLARESDTRELLCFVFLRGGLGVAGKVLNVLHIFFHPIFNKFF